jgi:short subunit dehydrogenase-like uncharacterized protein
MTADFMIYGANGYTGRLASEYAKSFGLRSILAGRNAAEISSLASSLDYPFRIFDITDDQQQVESQLAGIKVLLNCAGPFARTAEPLILACMQVGVHYLDISAELNSYHLVEKHDNEAAAANVMLLPGCGGSVAMLGCLTSYALEQAIAGDPAATMIDVALHVTGSMSRGSAISAAESVTQSRLQRVKGNLVSQDATNTVNFDFDNGKGLVECSPVTLPDLITIWKSTNVTDIRTFVHVSGEAFPTGPLNDLPDGPTAEQRQKSPYDASVRITLADGSVRHAVLHTVNGYSFTSIASAEAVRLVMAGAALGGFQAPAGLFGSMFLKVVPGSTLKVL